MNGDAEWGACRRAERDILHAARMLVYARSLRDSAGEALYAARLDQAVGDLRLAEMALDDAMRAAGGLSS